MKDEKNVNEKTDQQKRKFLKKAGAAAIASPAAGVLLTSASKPAVAAPVSLNVPSPGPAPVPIPAPVSVG